jgi:2-methylcitrate dehydratase PrpD
VTVEAGPDALFHLVDSVARHLPSDAELTAADHRIFDSALSVALGSALEDWPAVYHSFGQLLGAGDACGFVAASFASCARGTEVDDIHLASCTTPGAVVVPVMLSLAPLGAPCDQLRSAVIAGYEAVAGTALLIGGPAALQRGIWPTRAVAPMGAAVTAAMALGLGPKATCDAVAMAATARFAGNLPEPARQLSLGISVLCGVSAAFAASEGMRGGPDALRDWMNSATAGAERRGARASAGRRDLEGSVQAAVLTTCVKPFCSARQALTATAAVRALGASEPDLRGQLDRLVVGVPTAHVAMVNRPTVSSRLESIASIPYQVALAIDAPDALDDVRRSVLRRDEPFAELMGRVSVVADPVCDERFPEHWDARVTAAWSEKTTSWLVEGVPGERVASFDSLEDKGARLLAAAEIDLEVLRTLRELSNTGDFSALSVRLRHQLSMGAPRAEASP